MELKNKLKFKGLINLHLLKYQVYKNLNNSSVNNISIELKQVLKIIYLYNIQKKRIIFVGFPYNKRAHNQLKNTTFMSKSLFIKKLQKQNASNLSKNFDLMVFYQISNMDYSLLKKLNNIDKPSILFCKNCESNNINYKVTDVSKNKKLKLFIYFLIFSILIKNVKL